MTLSGHVENGAIVLDHSVTLPEGAVVRIQIIGLSSMPIAEENHRTPSLLERLGDVVGAIDDLPTDGARNLDHYLYGTPKR